MSYQVIVSPEAQQHIKLHEKAGNVALVRKIITFLEELKQHPRTGTGKPEPMRYHEAETWSRRIDHKHRLVYEIHDHKLIIIALSAHGHYSDK